MATLIVDALVLSLIHDPSLFIGPRQVARYELIVARSPLIFTLSSPQNTPDTHVVSLMIITVHIIIPKEVI